MSLSPKDVDHVAKLARLALTDEEREKYRLQLAAVLDYIQSLDKFDVKNTAPTAQTAALSNVWREDVARVWGDTEALLSNAPDREDVYFKVKKIIE